MPQSFLIVLVLFGAVTMIGGYVVYKKAGDWTRGFSAMVIVALGEDLVKQSEFSEEENARIMLPLRNLATKIEKGEVSFEQGIAIFESMKNSALPYFLTRVIEITHLEGKGFSAEEVSAARSTLERLRYALSTGEVSFDQFSKAVTPVIESQSEGEDEFMTVKPTTQAAEVKEFLSRTNSLLQSEGIAESVPATDYAAELERAIQVGLQQ